MSGPRFNLTHDGNVIVADCTEIEAMNYIHRYHAYSFSHARRHEGYKLEAIADADLREASEGFTCAGCGRPESDCSEDPCADVIADREATV